MKFKINNTEWTIIEQSKQEMINLYKELIDPKEDIYFVFGITNKPYHIIFINQDMCEEQKTNTLKHELMHCYIWSYGLGNTFDFDEEMVCDLVASSNDFINEVVDLYLGIKPLYVCDINKNMECAKKSCYINGGECMQTDNKKFANSRRGKCDEY